VVGRYVTIEGKKRRFFGMVTDISLGVTDEQITISPRIPPYFHRGNSGRYGDIRDTARTAMLTIGGMSPLSVKDPAGKTGRSFSRVKLASEADMETVFGKEDNSRFFIGNPLDMETKLCLNLEELVKRSNGIFGKSAQGKHS